MTDSEQQLILTLYKSGKTYREIWELTKISPHSVASFLRRKHKNLVLLRQIARKRKSVEPIRKIKEVFNVPDYQAQAIYDSIFSRFEIKRQNIKGTGKDFTCTFESLDIPKTCPILGIPLNYFCEQYRDDTYPTFDRIDNTKGYIAGNVHIISWRANRIKNDGSAAEHRKIADYLDSLTTRREAPREDYTTQGVSPIIES